MKLATWYVTEDGQAVDPGQCAPDDAGVLRHSSGVAVAMRGNAYSSRAVDLDDVPAIDPASYRTRESRSRNR